MDSIAAYEVGIVAADGERLVRFYVNALGMTVHSDITATVEMSRCTGLSAAGYRVIRLSTNAGQRFKIAWAPDTIRQRPDATFPMTRAGNFYVTFLVRDVHSLHARLGATGVELRSERVVEVRPGVWLFLATDPEGNFLEFVEYADLAGYQG